MSLKAGVSKQFVDTNDMKYKKPSRDDPSREYDACYYEVTLDSSILDEYIPKKLHIQITKKTAMNTYIYGGLNRLEAKESLIQDNEQATFGTTYSVGIDKGFLVVAYPNEGTAYTEFGFSYWVEAISKAEQAKEEEEARLREEEEKKRSSIWNSMISIIETKF